MSNERSAPKGRLWATPGDLPHQHAISREFALDSGLPDPDQYPSWPNYPDERNLPVAFEARARWRERLAKIQAKQPVTKAVTIPPRNDSPAGDVTILCVECGKPVGGGSGKPRKFCSGACRVRHLRSKKDA